MGFLTVFPDGSVPIRGELITADATTATLLTLYTSYDAVAFTLGSTQQFYITAVSMVTDTAMTIDLFNDVATAGTVNIGERILSGAVAANGGLLIAFPFPIPVKVGTIPKGKASAAGNLALIVHGYAK